MELIPDLLKNKPTTETNLEVCYVIDRFLRKKENKAKRMNKVIGLQIMNRLTELLECCVDEDITENLLNIFYYMSNESAFEIKTIATDRFLGAIQGHLDSNNESYVKKALLILTNCNKDEETLDMHFNRDTIKVLILFTMTHKSKQIQYHALDCISSFLESKSPKLINSIIEFTDFTDRIIEFCKNERREDEKRTLSAINFIEKLLINSEFMENRSGNPVVDFFEKNDYDFTLSELRDCSSGEIYNRLNEIINRWFPEEDDSF